MNNEEKKRLRREWEEKESRKEALSRVRRIGEDIAIRGIGLIKLQILVFPSFSEGECWDFRIASGQLNVYKSVVLSKKGVFLPGYMKVKISKEILEILQKFQSIQIPVILQQEDIGILDGTSYRVCFFSSSSNIMSLSWSSNSPEAWSDVVSCVNKLLEVLRSSELTAVEP